MEDLDNPADHTTFNHVGLRALSQTELLESAKSVLSQIRVIAALRVECFNQHSYDIVILEKIRSALVFISQAVQESHQVLLDLERVGVEQNLEYAALVISLASSVGTLDLQQVKVDEGGQDLPTHRGRDTGQAPAQGLQSGTDVSFIRLLTPEESLEFAEVKRDEADGEPVALGKIAGVAVVILAIIHRQLVRLLFRVHLLLNLHRLAR